MKRFTETPTSRPLRRWSSISALSLLLGTALLGACVGQGNDPDSEAGPDSVLRWYGVAEFLPGTLPTPPQFGDLSAGDREVTLERLEVQLDYLMKEMEEIRAEEDSIFSEWLRGDRTPAPPRGSPKGQRRRLLNELYLQRLLSFEVLRMEVETELRQGS